MPFSAIETISQKIVVLLSGAPTTVLLRHQLVDLYEEHGNWGGVAAAVDAYANALTARHPEGELGVVKFIALNGFGLRLTDAEAGSQLTALNNAGLTTWSARLAHVITNVTGVHAATLENRAAAANQLTSVLRVTPWINEYDWKQPLAAGREWLQGIGPSDASRELALQHYFDLFGRLRNANVERSVLDDDIANATVFIDTDNDGLRDTGEALTMTNSGGRFTFANTVLPGPVVVTGGTNLTTNLPFTAVLKAPTGAPHITPLTTLVQQLLITHPALTQFDAEAKVFAALDLAAVDLSHHYTSYYLLDSSAPRAQVQQDLDVQAAGSQILSLMYVGAALIANQSGGDNGAHSVLAALTQAVASGDVDLADAATLGAVIVAALRASGVMGAGTSAADVARLTALSAQAGTALANLNELSQHAVDVFGSGANPSGLDAVSDIYKLEALAQAGLAAEITANTSADLGTVVAGYTGTALLAKLEHIEAGVLARNYPLTAGFVTTPPPQPFLALQADTGSSLDDYVTANGQVNVDGLRSGGSWEYSLDGGANWQAGSGSRVELTGDGARSLLVRQTDAFDRTSGLSAPLNFTLDTQAPAAPSLELHADTGISASDAVTRDGRIHVGGLENGATWQYSVNGGTRWMAGSGTLVTLDDLGAKHVLVRQADVAGNLSAPATLDFLKLPDASVKLQVDGYNGLRFDGVNIRNGVGTRVSSAGDVNGDGIDDMLVSAPYFDTVFVDGYTYAEEGAVYVVFGKAGFTASAGEVELAGLDGSNGFRIDGVTPSDFLGEAVSSGGDINGDGYADVLIGARRAPGGDYTGASYVVFGKADFSASGGVLKLANLDGNNGFSVHGIEPESRLGYSLSDAGDVNGDGYDDILLGMHDTFQPDGHADSTYLIFGKAAGFASTLDLAALDGSNGVRLQGPATTQQGHRVSAAGDINGDGYDDVVIGAPQVGNGGAAYVVFGSADFRGTAGRLELAKLGGTDGFRIEGTATYHLGGSVASGDIDGDGYADLLIGAGGFEDYVYLVYGQASYGGAAALSLDALDGQNGSRLQAAVSTHYGEPIIATGDFNADGYDDIFVSSGVGSVVYGTPNGYAPEFDLATLDGVTGFNFEHSSTYDPYGASPADAGFGDFDGDGDDDLLLGLPDFSTGTNPNATGAAIVVYGEDFGERGGIGGGGASAQQATALDMQLVGISSPTNFA